MFLPEPVCKVQWLGALGPASVHVRAGGSNCMQLQPPPCTTMQQSMQRPGPDLCTLHLWCFPSFNWCKHSTCTGRCCHQLKLLPVVLFHSVTFAHSPLAHVVLLASATCAGGAYSRATDANSVLAITQLTLYIYIYIYIYIYSIYCMVIAQPLCT